MQYELRFPASEPPDAVHPDASRKTPALWIERLIVLRELKGDSESVVRDIRLRRGLNILWAPPSTEPVARLFGGRISGHTAGKTMFCRLVRYILGERQFANESTRRRIRRAFQNAWVVGAVHVGDDQWTAVRPLGIGPHPFCVRGPVSSLFDAQVERLDYSAFLDAVAEATVADLPAKRLPGKEEAIRWDHLLEWIARDQECRFADAFEWRHKSSDSESPALDADDRQFLVRSVIGLITDAERAELQRNAELVAEKSDAASRAPFLEHQANVDYQRLCERFGRPDLPRPADGLFGDEAKKIVDALAEALSVEEQAANADRSRDEALRAVEDASAAEALEAASLKRAQEEQQHEAKTLAQIQANGLLATFASLPHNPDFCPVPIKEACEEGRRRATDGPIDLTQRRAGRTLDEELSKQRERVASHDAIVSAKQAAWATSKQAQIDARREFMRVATRIDERNARIARQRAELEQTAKMVERASTAWRESTKLRTSIELLDGEIRRSQREQERLRRDVERALGAFSKRYDYVVRALLGEQVLGSVESAGRSLSLSVVDRGESDSAALTTVKLLAFDLAALTESVEGRGHFPRLLVHDGPREADMAPEIYARLFLYAKRLEECFGGEPSFQYIVTTTAPPPEGLQADPWLLRPVLDASKPEGRLLGIDL